MNITYSVVCHSVTYAYSVTLSKYVYLMVQYQSQLTTLGGVGQHFIDAAHYKMLINQVW